MLGLLQEIIDEDEKEIEETREESAENSALTTVLIRKKNLGRGKVIVSSR